MRELTIKKIENIPINDWRISEHTKLTGWWLRGSIETTIDDRVIVLRCDSGRIMDYTFDIMFYKDGILVELIENIKSDILSKLLESFMMNFPSHVESKKRAILLRHYYLEKTKNNFLDIL